MNFNYLDHHATSSAISESYSYSNLCSFLSGSIATTTGELMTHWMGGANEQFLQSITYLLGDLGRAQMHSADAAQQLAFGDERAYEDERHDRAVWEEEQRRDEEERRRARAGRPT